MLNVDLCHLVLVGTVGSGARAEFDNLLCRIGFDITKKIIEGLPCSPRLAPLRKRHVPLEPTSLSRHPFVGNSPKAFDYPLPNHQIMHAGAPINRWYLILQNDIKGVDDAGDVTKVRVSAVAPPWRCWLLVTYPRMVSRMLMRRSAPQPRSRKTPRGGRMMARMILQMSLQRDTQSAYAQLKPPKIPRPSSHTESAVMRMFLTLR